MLYPNAWASVSISVKRYLVFLNLLEERKQRGQFRAWGKEQSADIPHGVDWHIWQVAEQMQARLNLSQSLKTRQV